jgi:hypothetical protein
MQIAGAAHALPACGSHSPPKVVFEPQTLWSPDVLVTLLHTSSSGKLVHAASFGASQEM